VSHWDESRARDVVAEFHAAALRSALWPSALQNLAALTGAEGCMLAGGPTSSVAPICSPSMTEFVDFTMDGGMANSDARIEKSIASFQRGHDVVTQSMLFSSKERADHSLAAAFINRFNNGPYAEIKLAGEGPGSVLLKLQRLSASGPFSESVIEHLRRLRPELQVAGKMALQAAEIHHDGLMVALTLFNCGAVLLDLKGAILRVNAAAEGLIIEGLNVRDRMLRANVAVNDISLQKLIHSLTVRGIVPKAEPSGAIAILRRGRSPILVHSGQLPVSHEDPLRQAGAVLMIVDPDAFHAPQMPELRQMFGLTTSEVAIAVALTSGHEVEEIARTRHVSPGTLRVQLKSIFLKTGVRRQSELVALLLRVSRLPRQGLW
jgi:DNA-binding CsgD family transcriptional regulator